MKIVLGSHPCVCPVYVQLKPETETPADINTPTADLKLYAYHRRRLNEVIATGVKLACQSCGGMPINGSA